MFSRGYVLTTYDSCCDSMSQSNISHREARQPQLSRKDRFVGTYRRRSRSLLACLQKRRIGAHMTSFRDEIDAPRCILEMNKVVREYLDQGRLCIKVQDLGMLRTRGPGSSSCYLCAILMSEQHMHCAYWDSENKRPYGLMQVVAYTIGLILPGSRGTHTGFGPVLTVSY